MRHLLHLAYLGTHYHGWQTQAREHDMPTVQGALQAAFAKTLGYPVHVTGCGRTDAGVHATNYYAHVDLPALDFRQNSLVTADLVQRLNHLLPEDIAIYRCWPVADTMHAQRSATFRRYQYTFNLYKNPFHEGTSARYHERKLDLNLMSQVVDIYAAATDFRAFCRRPEQYPHTTCRIDACTLEVLPKGAQLRTQSARSGHEVHKTHLETAFPQFKLDASQGRQLAPRQAVFTIQADRFLQNMVRLLVARMLEVGSGIVSLEELQLSLRDGTPTRFQSPAWAGGLALVEVGYGEAAHLP